MVLDTPLGHAAGVPTDENETLEMLVNHVRGLLGQHYRQASAHRMTGENTARDRKVLEHCLAVCRHLAGTESVGAEGRRPVAPLVEQNDAAAFFNQLFSYQVKTSKVVENPVGQNHRRTIAS